MNQFIKSSTAPASGNISLENVPAWLIGSLVGAGAGILGSDYEGLSGKKKFRKGLKNALLFGALGGLGTQGVKYGIEAVDKSISDAAKENTDRVLSETEELGGRAADAIAATASAMIDKAVDGTKATMEKNEGWVRDNISPTRAIAPAALGLAASTIRGVGKVKLNPWPVALLTAATTAGAQEALIRYWDKARELVDDADKSIHDGVADRFNINGNK